MTSMIRRREVDTVRTFLEQHSVVAIIGGAGYGQSDLLRSLEREWPGHVIRVPFSRREATTRFSGVDILLASLSALGANGVDRSDGTHASRESELEVGEQIVAALGDARFPDNTLIIIPDADGMDESSQVVLGQIVRRLRTGRVRIALTARSVTEESPLSGIPSCELQPLGSTEMAEFAHRLASGPIAEEVVQFVTRVAAGRPEAVGHILAQLTPSQRQGHAALPMPVRVGRVVEPMVSEIIGELNPDVETALKLLATAPLTPIRSLRRQFPQLWESVEDLEFQGVLERRGPYVCIAHGLVRAFVHGGMRAGERFELHERLAQLCAGSSARLSRWHASFSTLDDDAAERLVDDGLSFVTGGYAAVGIEFIERAIRLSSEIGVVADRLLDCAESLFARGELGFATRYIRIVSSVEDAGIAVRARAFQVSIDFARHQRVPSRLLNSWTPAEREEAPTEVARLQLVLGLCHVQRRELSEAQILLDSALELAAHFGNRESQLAEAVEMLLQCSRGNDERARQVFGELNDVHAGDKDPALLVNLALGLMLTEHYECAEATLDRLESQPDSAWIWKTQAAYVRAELSIRRGDVQRAIELIEQFDSTGSDPSTVRKDRFLALLYWKLNIQNRASQAESVRARLIAHARTSKHLAALAELYAFQGYWLLRRGSSTEAMRHLRRCEELSPQGVSPNVYRYVPDMIEALVDLDQRDHAALLTRRLKMWNEQCESTWLTVVLRRSEALLATGEKSLEAFRRVLGSLTAEDSPFETGITRLILSKRLNSIGARSRAQEQARIAAGLLTEAGAAQIVEMLSPAAEPSAVEPRASKPESRLLSMLSEDERTVVEFVRSGLKNREIASRMFVSLRTVELRLTAVYRKLGIASRTELIARLAGTPELAAVG